MKTDFKVLLIFIAGGIGIMFGGVIYDTQHKPPPQHDTIYVNKVTYRIDTPYRTYVNGKLFAIQRDCTITIERNGIKYIKTKQDE